MNILKRNDFESMPAFSPEELEAERAKYSCFKDGTPATDENGMPGFPPLNVLLSAKELFLTVPDLIDG